MHHNRWMYLNTPPPEILTHTSHFDWTVDSFNNFHACVYLDTEDFLMISMLIRLYVLAVAQAQKAVNYIVGKEDTEGHGK